MYQTFAHLARRQRDGVLASKVVRSVETLRSATIVQVNSNGRKARPCGVIVVKRCNAVNGRKYR
jgi:hypothetical protein